MGRRLTRISVILIAVFAVASISFAAAATVAAGKSRPTTTVSIKSTGTLAVSSFGPGANVTITYSCFPGFGGKGGGGYGGFGSVNLGDLAGNQGFAFFTPTCNDKSQTLAVFVQGGFRAGGAAASATVCGFDCNFASREIRLS